MKMNKKGFIFAETLISTAIMLLLLVSFYVFSINFIDNQSKNKNYENVEEIYKLANVRLFLYRNTDNFNELIKNVKDKSCISLNNIQYSDKSELTEQYNMMITKFDIDQLYLCNFEKDNQFTDNFKDYFDFVRNKFKDKYRIIAHFNTKNRFASIKVWEVSQ